MLGDRKDTAETRTPRQSSIRSSRSRPPTSLRLLNRVTTPSTASLSLVYASSDPTASTSARSEESLTKQLDGHGQGKNIGLRSRRGSAKTVRTDRTVSVSTTRSAGVEEDESAAGPSTLPPAEVVVPEVEEGREGRAPVRLNPKKSSSWMRWNSPAPSFPRSVSKDGAGKGKGKEREMNTEMGLEDGTRNNAPTSDGVGLGDGGQAETSSDKDEAQSGETGSDEAKRTEGKEQEQGTDPPATRGRWWSRATPRAASSNAATVLPPLFRNSTTDSSTPKEALTQAETPPPQDAPPQGPTYKAETSKAIQGSSVDETADLVQSPPTPITDQDDIKPSPAPAKKGWGEYLGWSSAKPSADSASDRPSVAPTESRPVSSGPSAPDSAAMSHQASSDAAPKSPSSEPAAPTLPPAEQPIGWGTYLYSFVSTSKPSEPAFSQTSEAVRPDGPAADKEPEFSEPAPLPVGATPPVPAPAATSLAPPSTAASLGVSPSVDNPGSTRKSSMSSQSGWLNYLALRASQKKIANASTASIKSGKERKSLEMAAEEEVMDFSSDPNFPAAAAPDEAMKQEKASAVAIKKDDASVSKKASQNPAVKNRRLSIESTKSSQSTPFGSSPMKKSASKTGAPSALPHPPVPAQPSFVIPTFDDTFNRPPRSLPPLTEGGQGSGLAWRALGAVGGYVYRNHPQQAEPAIGAGHREGRKVGADLPRKIGLDGRADDEGWKHVKRVAIVGVHGWFPAKMLNSVIGEPTGTSVKFTNMMTAAVKRFFDERGVHDIRLTPMPLEGEGTIESRVDRLYKAYLSNPAWINDLRRADAIFFAAHSQGCIVTTHLISRMIAQGHIRTPLNQEAVSRCEWAFGPIGVVPDTPRRRGQSPSGAEGGNQKVAMLAMCGVHLGPLYSISTSTVIQPYLQWFENAAARELFEFQDSTSAVSEAYQKALSMVLENEVKMVLLASYNDQVVPIYGASFSTAKHPLLLRALFVDGASYAASDFMTNLLSFAFMLRNAGIDDQRLVEHLSEATAGSLTGLGHSAPYEDKGCYDLTVKYLFLSGPAKQPLPPLEIEAFAARDVRSDFELPWIMRALVDSQEVRDLFPNELKDLKEGVVAWRPVTKALREIKKRLEPMAGRQRLRPDSIKPDGKSSTSLNELGSSPRVGPSVRKDW